MPKLIFNNPLKIETGTGISGSVDGASFETEEFLAKSTQNVSLFVGQEIETDSDVTFNNVISSGNVTTGNLTLGDGFISSSTGLVSHTGSVEVMDNIFVSSMNTSGQINAAKIEASVTQSFTIFESGSTKFGDDISDIHNVTGSLITSGSFKLNEYNVNEISNDTSLGDEKVTSLVSENAIKTYFTDTGTLDKNNYLRKSFVHTGSFTSVNTSSFTAVTASAPTGFTGTTEQDFMFFINGMLIENDALDIVQKTSTNLELRLNTSGLGYELESDDEVIGFGKFNS
jgi:hypothetical protein